MTTYKPNDYGPGLVARAVDSQSWITSPQVHKKPLDMTETMTMPDALRDEIRDAHLSHHRMGADPLQVFIVEERPVNPHLARGLLVLGLGIALGVLGMLVFIILLGAAQPA